VRSRQRISVLVLAALAALPLAGAGSAATMQAQREEALVGAVNGVRTAHGLRPVAVDRALTRAARGHSAWMVRTQTFVHGATAIRMRRSGAAGPCFGENLAWGAGTRAAARELVQMWLASPPHRANLLRPGFRRVGVGVSVGSFAGFPGATVVTANFAGA
jgi:uncharacterized protein YkwD